MIKLDLDRNDHTMLMIGMWGRMSQDGDIDTGFMSETHIITRFFQIFAPPTQTFIDMDDEGIFFAAWFQPFLSGFWQGLWVRSDKRKSPKVFKNWIDVLNQVFEHTNIILGITKRHELLEPHSKLGYDISMVIPDIYEGSSGWIVQLNKHRFKYLKTKETENGRRLSIKERVRTTTPTEHSPDP